MRIRPDIGDAACARFFVPWSWRQPEAGRPPPRAWVMPTRRRFPQRSVWSAGIKGRVIRGGRPAPASQAHARRPDTFAARRARGCGHATPTAATAASNRQSRQVGVRRCAGSGAPRAVRRAPGVPRIVTECESERVPQIVTQVLSAASCRSYAVGSAASPKVSARCDGHRAGAAPFDVRASGERSSPSRGPARSTSRRFS